MDNLRTIVGTVLWWAEGTKSRRDKRWKNAITYPLEITSTDPAAVRAFLNFLREDLKIDENKLKIQLQVHANDNLNELEGYWSKLTNVPLARFQKTIIRPVGGKPGKSKGTCKVRYSNKELYLKAKSILDELIRGVA